MEGWVRLIFALALAAPGQLIPTLPLPTDSSVRRPDHAKLDGSFRVPLPTEDLLAWTRREVGAFFSFDIVSMIGDEGVANTQTFCLGVGGNGGWLPPPHLFKPEKLDVDNWVQAAVAFGAKYAVLTAQHCGGFSMWPTDIFDETGFDYAYSTRYTPFRGGGYDVVADFIASCRKYGVLPGIYYSLNENYYLNAGLGVVRNTTLLPGQEKVSQELYAKIVLAQMRELWSNYGNLSEIWFDGGCNVAGTSDEIAAMLEQLQPHAVYFGGCAKTNNLRWVGTESGLPNYPIWSTSDGSSAGCTPGQGEPDGPVFCPAESDTRTQDVDQWFWRADLPVRNLSELQGVYYHTVGQNTNLLLNVPANRSGLIDNRFLKSFREFGTWMRECFSNPVATISGTGYVMTLSLPTKAAFQFNNVVARENQTNGELVLGFSITAYSPNGTYSALFEDGLSVGNRFARFVGAQNVTEVVLTVTAAYSEPTFTEFSVYDCDMMT